MNSKLSLIVVSIAVALLGGCATTPYFKAPDTAKAQLGGYCPPAKASVEQGLRAADALAALYHSKADQERAAQSFAVGAVLPLGAWASFQGVAERGSKDSIAAIGLTGATLYTLGTLYSSSPKQAVYLEGVTSLNCVAGAFAPFGAADTSDPNARDLDGTDLKAKSQRLVTALDALVAASANAADGPDKTRAELIATNATMTATQAYRRMATITSLGAPLCSQIAAIGAAVAREVRKTDPTPGAVLASVKLLPQIAGQIAVSPETPKVTAPAVKKSGNDSVREADELRTMVGAVLAAERQVKIALDAGADPNVAITAAKACALPAALNKLVISPDTTAISIAKGASAEISAEVGVPPAQVAISGVKAAAVAVDVMVRGSSFGIVIKGVEPTGDTPAAVKISDGSGLVSKTIAVTVTAPPAAPPAPPAGVAKSACAPRDTDEVAIVSDLAKVRLLQAKLGMPQHQQTRCAASITRANVASYATENGLSTGSSITKELFEAVLADAGGAP